MTGRLRELVGVELGPSSWLDVTQERIDAFAEATDDRQWIHVDPERAAGGPFGGTIAHGFLTLSLCVPLLAELLPPSDGMVVNYGVNRVRFPAAVPAGSRIRGRLRVTSVEEGTAGERANIEAVVECEGVEKPVCVAELVVLTVSLQPEAS
jgi:acyl dehydratase